MKYFLKHFEEIIGGSLFLLMLFVLIAQILARQVFDLPLKQSEELARFLFVYVGYLGVSASIKENNHVYIDFFVKKLPEKVQRYIDFIVQMMVLGILVIMLLIGVNMTIRKLPVMIVSLGISYAYMYVALPATTLLMIYRHIERNVTDHRERGKGMTI